MLFRSVSQSRYVPRNRHNQNTHSDCVYYEGQVYDFCTNITSGPGQGQRIGGKIVLSSISMMADIVTGMMLFIEVIGQRMLL